MNPRLRIRGLTWASLHASRFGSVRTNLPQNIGSSSSGWHSCRQRPTKHWCWCKGETDERSLRRSGGVATDWCRTSRQPRFHLSQIPPKFRQARRSGNLFAGSTYCLGQPVIQGNSPPAIPQVLRQLNCSTALNRGARNSKPIEAPNVCRV